MEKQHLEELRNNIEDLKEILDTDFAEIKILEEEPVVQRYKRLIELQEKLNGGLLLRCEADLIQYEVGRFDKGQIYETNNIWFCLGACHTNNCFKLFRIKPKFRGDCIVFVNLENEQIVHIVRPEDKESFLEDHYVIDNGKSFDWITYNRLRNEFFNQCVLNGQEETTEKFVRSRCVK